MTKLTASITKKENFKLEILFTYEEDENFNFKKNINFEVNSPMSLEILKTWKLLSRGQYYGDKLGLLRSLFVNVKDDPSKVKVCVDYFQMSILLPFENCKEAFEEVFKAMVSIFHEYLEH